MVCFFLSVASVCNPMYYEVFSIQTVGVDKMLAHWKAPSLTVHGEAGRSKLPSADKKAEIPKLALRINSARTKFSVLPTLHQTCQHKLEWIKNLPGKQPDPHKIDLWNVWVKKKDTSKVSVSIVSRQGKHYMKSTLLKKNIIYSQWNNNSNKNTTGVNVLGDVKKHRMQH